METLLIALFAWLIGLLGHRPIEIIRNRYRNIAFRRTLVEELEEMQLKLAYSAFLVASRQHRIDRALLIWMKPILAAYRGLRADPGIEKMVQELSTKTDDELQSLPGDPPLIGLTSKKFVLPFTERILPDLYLFPPPIQRHVLDLLALLDQLNQEVDRNWSWNIRTFDSALGDDNHARVLRNFEVSVGDIGRLSQELAQRIDVVLAYCRTGKVTTASPTSRTQTKI